MIPITDMFPAMAQAILTSDDTIANRPEVVKGFVAATLKGMADVMSDPAGSAELLASSLPQFEGKAPMLENIMLRYTDLVYATPDGQALGSFDAARVETVANFYKDSGIVTEVLPVDDYFTNDMLPAN